MVSQYAKLMARDATKKFDRERSRQLALHWYRKILRAGEKWEGSAQEKEYIKHEARKLFRQNKHVSDPEEIENKIFEAESRYGLALHYKIPYPRPYHLDPQSQRQGEQLTIVPAYMDSYVLQERKDREKERIKRMKEKEHLDSIRGYKDEF